MGFLHSSSLSSLGIHHQYLYGRRAHHPRRAAAWLVKLPAHELEGGGKPQVFLLPLHPAAAAALSSPWPSAAAAWLSRPALALRHAVDQAHSDHWLFGLVVMILLDGPGAVGLTQPAPWETGYRSGPRMLVPDVGAYERALP